MKDRDSAFQSLHEHENEERDPMDDGKEETSMSLEYTLTCSVFDEAGREIMGGEGKAYLSQEKLSIMPEFSQVLEISLLEIKSMSCEAYRIYMNLVSGEKLQLFYLGHQLDNFWRNLSQFRNELLIKSFLMEEKLMDSFVDLDFVQRDQFLNETVIEGCSVRLYETGLVVLSKEGMIRRVPYSFIHKVSEKNYSLEIEFEFGVNYEFRRLGRQLDPFRRRLSMVMSNLDQKVAVLLKELLPKENALTIRKLGAVLKEGKAAKREQIDTVSHGLWDQLEYNLKGQGMYESYHYLKDLAMKNKIAIGVKQGVMGDLTGLYTWFLIPIASSHPNQPGNAIAMEAVSGSGSGKATYFFKIADRQRYKKGMDVNELNHEIDRCIERLNYCMYMVNFRREPIYLTETQLSNPKYVKYQYAIENLSALQELRSSFIGRIVHRSKEQWEQDVTELLHFNVTIQEEEAKWHR